MPSLYPDGTSNSNWERLRVILPSDEDVAIKSNSKLQSSNVKSIKCHRTTPEGREQYLVKWKRIVDPRSNEISKHHCFSWHFLHELEDCLHLIQRYLASIAPDQKLGALEPHNRKRHSDEDVGNLSTSRSRSGTPVKQVYSTNVLDLDAINCTLHRQNGTIMARPTPKSIHVDIPTAEMQAQASRYDTLQAHYKIHIAFDRKLTQFRSPASLEIVNHYDRSRPPLNFEFVGKNVPGRGVHTDSSDTMIGCGNIAARTGQSSSMNKCRPDMGKNIGCEYAAVCECLEFAAVNTDRLTASQKKQYEAGETAGLPRRFPYLQSGLLQHSYLKSRNAIYECNSRCHCGPSCKNRLVQKGRTIPLEIFKTEDRGWGLRSSVAISAGQFIDTYRGEIITNQEAEKREKNAVSGIKASYLYNLDKHVGEMGITDEDCYVIDGEHKGCPARFINHSCDPNLRQYTVSYNKYDAKIYEIAFFAWKDISPYEELTFDYLDKDEEDDDDEIEKQTQGTQASSSNKMKCHCGSKNCRGTLWM